MSTNLYILPESNYETFLESWEVDDTYREYGERWENATVVYTNFSGGLDRLFDVVHDSAMKSYEDCFSLENAYVATVAVKEELKQILAKQTNEALLEKWNDIMEYLKKVPDEEHLYFFTD